MSEGIEVRHRQGCPAPAGKCACQPSYRAVVRNRDGKVSRTFHRLADARSWRAQALAEIIRVPRRTQRAPTLEAASVALVEAMRSGAARTRSGDAYKPSAARAYDDSLRLHVLPALGRMTLDEITLRDVQGVADRLLATGANPSTVRNALMPLRVVFRRALRDGHVSASPCAHLDLPAVRGKRERIASPEEAERLLSVLEPRDRALWGCAFYAGLRLGELRALRGEHVDLAAGVINVREGWDEKEGGIAPKSLAGERQVVIVATLRDYLTEHAASAGSGGFVFGARVDAAFTPSAVRKRADRAWRKAGLVRITLHEARHTCASIFIAAGVNAKAISELMGHSSIAITFDRYGHLMPGSRDEARELVDAYLDRASR